MRMTEEDIIKIGDRRWRKIEDCDEITGDVDEEVSSLRADVKTLTADVGTLKTDSAVSKALLKGVLAVASITAAFLIPACLKIIMGV